MSMRAITTAILLATGAGAVAADRPEQLDRALAVTLARVEVPRAYFHSEGKPGCPALTAACRQAAYVVRGDIVVVSETRGDLTLASYSAGGPRGTSGWLSRAALAPLHAPRQPPGAWLGSWTRDDEASLVIAAERNALHVTGDALYGSHDPGRVARGAVNMGELDERGTPAGDRLTLGGTDTYDCRVALRLLGPYLIVADNHNCGGLNVSFSGVYRHTARRKRG